MNIQFVSILFCLLFFVEKSTAQDWSLAKDKNDIKVYTRKVEGWGIKEYKVHVTVKASLSKVIQVLKDVPGRYEWVHNSMEIREIESTSESVTIYTKVDAPWPVSDRDNITRFSFSYPTSKSARVEMTLIKTHPKAPVYSGVVRVGRVKGYWLVEDKGNGFIEIMQQCVAEPGGSIPDWLANSAVVDSPYNSMSKLKKYIEKS